MKLLALSIFLAAACGGPQKGESPIVKEGDPVSDTCCCKSSPATSEDGKPVYEPHINRMECSTRQGECEADVQCNGVPDNSPPSSSTSPLAPSDNGSLPPPQ
jgi:hypothetical protein